MLRRQKGCLVVKMQGKLQQKGSFLVVFEERRAIPPSVRFSGVGCIKDVGKLKEEIEFKCRACTISKQTAEDCPGVELNNARMVICMHNVTSEDRTAIEEHERQLQDRRL